MLLLLHTASIAQYVRSPSILTQDLNDGLASKRVSSIMQDHLGYIWLGTWFGLHRYDGYNFKVWQHDSGDSNSLTNNLVYWVTEDHQHRIWVGTRHGINLIDRDRQTITRFLNQPGDPGSLSDNEVEEIYEDSQGQIWVSTQSGELNLFVEADSSFRHWRARPADEPVGRLFLVREDPRDSNLLWVGADSDVYRFDRAAERFFSFQNAQYLALGRPDVFDLEFEGDSLLWMGTWGKGILKYDLRTDSLVAYGYYSEADRAADKVEVVLNMEPRTVDEFWTVTDIGPAIFNKRTGNFRFSTRELARQGEQRTLSSSRALCVDRSGIAWIGGFEGLSRLDQRTQRFLFYPIEARQTAMSTYFQVTDLAESSDGKQLFVASQNGDGIYILDQETEAIRPLPLPPDTFSNHLPMHFMDDLLLDHTGNLLAMNLNMLFQYDPQTDRLRPYFQRADLQDIYSDFYPFKLAEDEVGNLWFVSLGKGIMQYDLARDTLLVYQHAPGDSNSLLSGGGNHAILPDGQGKIWVSTRLGLSCLTVSTGQFEHIPSRPLAADGLNATDLRDLAWDQEGKLWVSTLFDGVYRLDPAAGPGKRIIHIDRSNGLLHNTVTALSLDKNGMLWAISEKGLSIIDPVTLAIQNFSEADGLLFFKSDMPVVSAPSGQMYIGALSGFLRCHPDSLRPNPALPPIYLHNFQVNGKPLDLAVDINALDTLELLATQNFFSFEMVALNYSNSAENQYAYQLEGLDPEAVQAGTRRFVSYSDLPGGWYTLRVKASNNDGVWNPSERQLVIHIAQPWYLQIWFILLCVLAAIGLGILAIQLRSRQVRKEERLKAAFNQQIKEVEMVALRAQMNPHFLFNCLNCINRYIVRNEPQKASEYLSDFAVLIRMILNHSEMDQIQLGEELKALKLYILMESLRFEERFDFDVVVTPAVEQDFVRVPPMILQPFVENAIWHGLMHSPDKGKLHIKIDQKEGFLTCTIEDNGIGRKKAAEIKSKSATLHKSMGMTITSFRLQAMGQLSGTKGAVDVVDLHDAAGIATGTRVIIKIPV